MEKYHIDNEYLTLLKTIMEKGEFRSKEEERTGTGTKGIFGYQYRCPNVAENFPLLTTKQVHFKSIVTELLWKLSGSTNIRPLVLVGNRIWNEWPYQNYLKKNNLEETYPRYSDKWHEHMKWFVEEIKNDEDFANQWGNLGPTYGHHIRNFDGYNPETDTFVEGFDQLADAIKTIKENPGSRRIIISLWNATENPYTLLPPCPCFYQFAVLGGKLHLQMYQRSCDTFLGVPFNTAQDSLFLMIMAQVCDLPAGDFIHTFGDAHIYSNHFDQVKEQLTREPRPMPKVVINPKVKNIKDLTVDDFTLEGYDPHPKITGQVAV
ncbi:thymidylate synthase [Patescibacteria group bacterium]|nr:thymidylate synthase [Patescibacteria group bacterium]